MKRFVFVCFEFSTLIPQIRSGNPDGEWTPCICKKKRQNEHIASFMERKRCFTRQVYETPKIQLNTVSILGNMPSNNILVYCTETDARYPPVCLCCCCCCWLGFSGSRKALWDFQGHIHTHSRVSQVLIPELYTHTQGGGERTALVRIFSVLTLRGDREPAGEHG